MRKMANEMREVGRKHAGLMREKAMQRKEEYLGARVPRELKEAVINRAISLGIPVSILIRNILEDAFNLPQSPSSASEAPTVSQAREKVGCFPGVIGWEKISLNRSMQCTECGRELAAGSMVSLGLAMPGEDHVILCPKCR